MAVLKDDGGGARLSGRLGGRVYRSVNGMTVVAAAPQANDARSPAQLAQRARLDLANRLWADLPLDAHVRWRAWAATRGGRGDNLFRGLAAKYLQVHGGNAAPTEPPASAFLGDGVVVAASSLPSGRSGVESVAHDHGSADDGGTPTLPSPKGEAPCVTFSASGPNSAGVVTELLLQRLPARHRLPRARDYRTRAFVAFAGRPFALPVAPGAYACAIRFVRAATGQATAVVPLGTVEVA